MFDLKSNVLIKGLCNPQFILAVLEKSKMMFESF